MKGITTITSKGQVTVPKEVRDQLGLKPADRVQFTVEDGVARMRKYALSIHEVAGTVPSRGISWEEADRIAKEERAEQWLRKNDRRGL
jgi:AbrB family looped-hinge helix DNA binding protein